MTSPLPTTETQPTPTPTPTPEPPAATFSDDQQREIDRRIAAARRQAEADAKKRFETDAAAANAAAEEERKRTAQIAAGEFDTVKVSLEKDRDTFRVRAETAEAALQTIWDERTTAMDAGMKALKADKDLPDWRYYPGDDASVAARWGWYQKASESVAAVSANRAAELDTNRLAGTPRRNGAGEPSLAQTRQELARMRGVRLTR